MGADAQRQRFDAAQDQPGIERARNGTGQNLLGFERAGELLVVGYRSAANHIAMPTEILGGALNHDIGPQAHWLLDIRSCEGIIDNEQQFVVIRELCYWLV